MTHLLQIRRLAVQILAVKETMTVMAGLCATLLLLLAPATAGAQRCWSSSWSMNFGDVTASGNTDVTTQIQYTCRSNASTTYFKICLFVPAGSGNTPGIAPRKMTDYNGHFIDFDLYSDPGRTSIIGPQNSGFPPYAWELTVPVANTETNASVNVYGRVPPVTTGAVAGGYQQDTLNGSTLLQYAWSNSAMPGDCTGAAGGTAGSTMPGFSGVKARVVNACTVSATDVNFGPVEPSATNLSASGTLAVHCPSGTPYNIGLAPSNGSSSGAGVMRGTGSNTDQVPYQLRSTAGTNGTAWGNTATSSSVGNGVAGTGSGTTQSVPVHVTVPGVNYMPDDYSDTVTVHVHY